MKIQQIKNKKVSSKSSHLDFVIYLMQIKHSLSSSTTPFAYIDSYNTELDDLVSVLTLINNHFLLLNKHIIYLSSVTSYYYIKSDAIVSTQTHSPLIL